MSLNPFVVMQVPSLLLYALSVLGGLTFCVPCAMRVMGGRIPSAGRSVPHLTKLGASLGPRARRHDSAAPFRSKAGACSCFNLWSLILFGRVDKA